jgi:hypothetical protein
MGRPSGQFRVKLSLLLRSISLKILTNEKRGELNFVSFDWTRFNIFTLKFSEESVQTPSCERPETAKRTLFLFLFIRRPIDATSFNLPLFSWVNNTF